MSHEGPQIGDECFCVTVEWSPALLCWCATVLGGNTTCYGYTPEEAALALLVLSDPDCGIEVGVRDKFNRTTEWFDALARTQRHTLPAQRPSK